MTIINNSTITGANAEAVVELKAEILSATVEVPRHAPSGNGSSTELDESQKVAH